MRRFFKDIGSGNQAAIWQAGPTAAAACCRARVASGPPWKGEQTVLYYALVFLLIAIVAAVFGFGGVAVVSAGIAKILFFVFIVLFLVSLITHMSRRV
jgi:uncharacterized membrane protein YtjA (UPF0391 family)